MKRPIHNLTALSPHFAGLILSARESTIETVISELNLNFSIYGESKYTLTYNPNGILSVTYSHRTLFDNVQALCNLNIHYANYCFVQLDKLNKSHKFVMNKEEILGFLSKFKKPKSSLVIHRLYSDHARYNVFLSHDPDSGNRTKILGKNVNYDELTKLKLQHSDKDILFYENIANQPQQFDGWLIEPMQQGIIKYTMTVTDDDYVVERSSMSHNRILRHMSQGSIILSSNSHDETVYSSYVVDTEENHKRMEYNIQRHKIKLFTEQKNRAKKLMEKAQEILDNELTL